MGEVSTSFGAQRMGYEKRDILISWRVVDCALRTLFLLPFRPIDQAALKK